MMEALELVPGEIGHLIKYSSKLIFYFCNPEQSTEGGLSEMLDVLSAVSLHGLQREIHLLKFVVFLFFYINSVKQYFSYIEVMIGQINL